MGPGFLCLNVKLFVLECTVFSDSSDHWLLGCRDTSLSPSRFLLVYKIFCLPLQPDRSSLNHCPSPHHCLSPLGRRRPHFQTMLQSQELLLLSRYFSHHEPHRVVSLKVRNGRSEDNPWPREIVVQQHKSSCALAVIMKPRSV